MMLSRIAENAYWMGRYIERAENLVRLLSVTENFSSDQAEQDAWLPILEVYADTENFYKTGKPITALNVARFYLADRTNLNSAFSCVHFARENARTLRHLISTESWRQISVFYDAVSPLAQKRFALSRLSDLCEEIRLACATHRGLMETTWYRDETWLFNRMGAALERADQVTRFLDMKTFQVDEGRDTEPFVAPDVAWWNTLLRSAAGYHAFQRIYSFNPQPEDAASFLLLDPQFPRSVRGAVDVAFTNLSILEKRFHGAPGADVKKAVADFDARLDAPPARLRGQALHKYIDLIQKDINTLGSAINERYFAPEV